MKSFLVFLVAGFVSAAVSLFIVLGHYPEGKTNSSDKLYGHQPAYQRVMDSGVLRCSYATGENAVYFDRLTNEMKGYHVELVETLANKLGLEVDWVGEVGYADFAEGLKTGRYDAFCGAISNTPERARVARFTDTMYYFPFYVYPRIDDNRFQSYDDLNTPDVSALSIDGEVFYHIVNKHFPKAGHQTLPNMVPGGQVLVDIGNNKADFAVQGPVVFKAYDKGNPNKMKQTFAEPLEIYPTNLAVNTEEEKLAKLLNDGISHMHEMGIIEQILLKHGQLPDNVLVKKKNYQISK